MTMLLFILAELSILVLDVALHICVHKSVISGVDLFLTFTMFLLNVVASWISLELATKNVCV